MKVRRNADLSPSKLVVNVMNDLRDTNGISLPEIVRYGSMKYGVKKKACKVPLELALKRGVKYNIVNIKNGLYRLNKPSFNPFNVFNLHKTGQDSKKLNYIQSYLGKKSKGCMKRAPHKKMKMPKKKVQLVVKEKGGGKKGSRCKWCKKLIQDKGRQAKSMRTKGKVQRRSMKKSCRWL